MWGAAKYKFTQSAIFPKSGPTGLGAGSRRLMLARAPVLCWGCSRGGHFAGEKTWFSEKRGRKEAAAGAFIRALQSLPESFPLDRDAHGMSPQQPSALSAWQEGRGAGCPGASSPSSALLLSLHPQVLLGSQPGELLGDLQRASKVRPVLIKPSTLQIQKSDCASGFTARMLWKRRLHSIDQEPQPKGGFAPFYFLH